MKPHTSTAVLGLLPVPPECHDGRTCADPSSEQQPLRLEELPREQPKPAASTMLLKRLLTLLAIVTNP
jgi:hypothetical protein